MEKSKRINRDQLKGQVQATMFFLVTALVIGAYLLGRVQGWHGGQLDILRLVTVTTDRPLQTK